MPSYENDLLFSLILSIINTTIYYVMTVYNLKKKIDEDKHELLMMFGVTFIVSFILKTYFNNGVSFGGETSEVIQGGGENYLGSHSTRPPF